MQKMNWLLCICVLFIFASCNQNSTDIEKTLDPTQMVNVEIDTNRKIGDQIIVAIEQYYLDVGDYPAKLDDLVPKYISEIPLTVTGQAFVYTSWTFDKDPYALHFVVTKSKYLGCYYSKRLSEWSCDYYNP